MQNAGGPMGVGAGGRTRYHQEPLFRPEGPEFEPIPIEKRKAFQFRRGPRGKTLYVAFFGAMVFGHYVYATGAWTQRELFEERHNVWSSVTTYLQAEADRKYLQSRRALASSQQATLFPGDDKRDAHFSETQYKTRWVRPPTDPFRQWRYARRQFDQAWE